MRHAPIATRALVSVGCFYITCAIAYLFVINFTPRMDRIDTRLGVVAGMVVTGFSLVGVGHYLHKRADAQAADRVRLIGNGSLEFQSTVSISGAAPPPHSEVEVAPQMSDASIDLTAPSNNIAQ
jgi:hypothetical protein